MLIIVVIMGEFKSTIIFFACLTRRTTSVFHRARSLIAIQHASKQACSNCGLDGDEMRDVFPLVRFPNQIVLGRFTLLFVTCVPARHPHGRVYVLLYIAAHAWSQTCALSNHLAPCCRGNSGKRGGKMKAEINEVSGTFLLPGRCPVEAVRGRRTAISCGVRLLTDMRPALIRTHRKAE